MNEGQTEIVATYLVTPKYTWTCVVKLLLEGRLMLEPVMVYFIVDTFSNTNTCEDQRRDFPDTNNIS